ncbi:MAG: ComEC/Rec2 family competence protein [Subdoligranulum sp.]
MTRKLAGFGLAFALAELAAAYLPPLASLLTAALFISLFLFAAFTQRRAARFALPAVAGLLAGLVWSAAYQLAVVKPAQSLAGQTYACTAIVQPDAETSWQPGNVRATLLITQLDGRKTSLKVYCTDLPYSEAGDTITGQFQLQPLRADSYRMSRYAKGTWLGASYQADYIWQGTSDALPYRLYHLRQAFAKRLTAYLPQNLAGVEAAMLLGEKSELTDEWSDTFRTAGIAHLLAVSGLHVALLCGLFAMGQGRRSRFSVPRVLLQITVLLLYMGLTGLPFSVFRAGVMFLIMLVGSLLLQPPDSLTALALAAIIIGVQQPFAPCDIGFQLSVCGVLGVLAASALAKRQTQFVQVRYAARHNQRRKTALPLPLAIVLRVVDAVQTAVLATLATLPVLLLHGMAASGAAVPANLLVVWLLARRWLGILALVLLCAGAGPAVPRGKSAAWHCAAPDDHPGRLVRGSSGGPHCPAGAVYFVGAGCFCCAGGAFLAYPAAAPLCARWLCVRSGSRYVGRHHAARCGTPGHGGHRGQWLRGGGAE